MPLTTLNVANGVIGLESLFDYCAERRANSPQYAGVHDGLVYDAYLAARRHEKRYNRKTNVMRDNRLGVLSRPSNPSEWPEASVEDATEYLMRSIWSNAVRAYDLATM